MSPLAYGLGSTAVDLAEFSIECSGLNFVLLEADRVDIAILCSTEDFLLIGGPRPFVVDAIGDPGRRS